MGFLVEGDGLLLGSMADFCFAQQGVREADVGGAQYHRQGVWRRRPDLPGGRQVHWLQGRRGVVGEFEECSVLDVDEVLLNGGVA